MRDPFPLQWPESWPRTKPHLRRGMRLATGYGRGRSDIKIELQRMAGANIIITSNVELNSNGVPDSRGASPSDPGVAVWWQEKGGVERVMAVDRWPTPGQNARAIAKSLDAMRGIERWGASQIIERAFSGFTALPAGGVVVAEPEWWEVLDVDSALFELDPLDLTAIVNSRYRRIAAASHPDKGGTTEGMAKINIAYEKAKEYLDTLGKSE